MEIRDDLIRWTIKVDFSPSPLTCILRLHCMIGMFCCLVPSESGNETDLKNSGKFVKDLVELIVKFNAN